MMRRIVPILLAAVVLMPALAEAGAAAQRHRIVSIGGAVTEIVAALGAADDLIAVDTTSVHPPAVVDPLPKVGYMRQLAAEGIIALKPTDLLVVEGSGPPGTLQVLAEAGVKPVMIPDVFTPEGIAAKMRAVGAALGRQAEAERLAADLAQRFAAVAAENTRIIRPVRVLFALSLQGGRLVASGSGTAADGAIRLAGAVNALADIAGYKAVGDEAIIAALPDVVLVMDRHQLNPKDVLAYPALAATPAGASGSLLTVDGVALLGFGPRTADAVAELRRRLYPDIAFAPLPPPRP